MQPQATQISMPRTRSLTEVVSSLFPEGGADVLLIVDGISVVFTDLVSSSLVVSVISMTENNPKITRAHPIIQRITDMTFVVVIDSFRKNLKL